MYLVVLVQFREKYIKDLNTVKTKKKNSLTNYEIYIYFLILLHFLTSKPK